jgi:hypothetical protein
MESAAKLERTRTLEQVAVRKLVLKLVLELVPELVLQTSRAPSLLLQKHPDFLHPVRPAAAQTLP